jgi:hypothetical protein
MKYKRTKTEGIENLEGESFVGLIKKYFNMVKEWVKPDPADPLWKTILKSIYKLIAVLVLIALSPVLLVVLLFVFFAAI